ncbi:MAG: hypothetical protein HOY71_29835, partial [Nonomuraea sp.]|nr:hypothetical protein [Nonomuraea sp.]
MLSLWRGEMCTASFRMPMDDVGRLLDTLDDGYAEATGEKPAVPAADPGTEVIPGTGQYHRPPPSAAPPAVDERPAPTMGPNDVLVARGTPSHPDKLVASYGEPRYGDSGPHYTDPHYADPVSGPQHYADPAPNYADPVTGPHRIERAPFSGPQYSDPGDPHTQPHEPFGGPQYTDQRPQYGEPQRQPFSGPQYSDPLSGPQYTEQAAPASGEPVYQLPGRSHPLSTDPLGFPSQAAPAYDEQTQRMSRPPQPDQGRGGYGDLPRGRADQGRGYGEPSRGDYGDSAFGRAEPGRGHGDRGHGDPGRGQ